MYHCIDWFQKRPVESGKQGTSTKKLKKDKAANATAKAVRQDANTQSMAPRVKPELTLPIMYVEEFLFCFLCICFFCQDMPSKHLQIVNKIELACNLLNLEPTIAWVLILPFTLALLLWLEACGFLFLLSWYFLAGYVTALENLHNRF